MGVAIRTLIATICLSLPIILCFCGCSQITPSTGITAPAVSDNFEESPMMITSFCFSHNGMSMADCYSYSITQDINSIRLQADLYAGNKTIDVVVDETVLENLGNIVSRHHLDQWNGFDKTNGMVLDGEGFSLSITLADENRITASGDNAFPKGYTDVKREICALFDALIDEYGNLYSKILVSDGLDYVMLNFTKRGGKHFFCSAGKKSDGTVSLDISIIDYEEFYPHESYQFFGSCMDFPFDSLQSAVRKYDVPSWNGWDKTAENYDECEWFQIEFGYESGEHICAMGTLYPNDYENVRSELLSVIGDFIECHNASFIPWQS